MEQHRSGIPSFAAHGELSLELVHATEAAALVCAGFLGKGAAEGVSNAAGDAMRAALDRSGITGTVVLSPSHNAALPPGATVGGGERTVDLGVSPVEGASQVARGHINAVSILVAVEPGGFVQLPAVSQMEKFVAGPGARGALDLDDLVADNLRRIAFARDARVQDLTVAILERPRHQQLIADVAAAGARIRTLEEGDFASAVMAALSVTVMRRSWPPARCAAWAASSWPGWSRATRRSAAWSGTPPPGSTAWRTWSGRPTSQSPSPGLRAARCCPGSPSGAATPRLRRWSCPAATRPSAA